MEQHKIPEFMQEYYQGSDMEGRVKLQNLARQYSDESATFLQTSFVSKQEFLRDWNRKTGQRKELTTDEALAPMREQYAGDAKQVAINHGYKEHTEEEPHEKQSIEYKSDRAAFLENLKTIHERSAQQQIRQRI